MQRLSLIVLAALVASCASVGLNAEGCGPNDKAIRLSPEAIDVLTDAEAREILIRNETLYKRGCAEPNKE